MDARLRGVGPPRTGNRAHQRSTRTAATPGRLHERSKDRHGHVAMRQSATKATRTRDGMAMAKPTTSVPTPARKPDTIPTTEPRTVAIQNGCGWYNHPDRNGYGGFPSGIEVGGWRNTCASSGATVHMDRAVLSASWRRDRFEAQRKAPSIEGGGGKKRDRSSMVAVEKGPRSRPRRSYGRSISRGGCRSSNSLLCGDGAILRPRHPLPPRPRCSSARGGFPQSSYVLCTGGT